MSESSKGIKWACAFAAAIMAASTQSVATAASASDPSLTLGEVIVTATRRETSLQKTPVAISVHDGDELRELGISTFNNLQDVEPSLQIEMNGFTPTFAVRGVESRNNTEVGNPAVSVARNGFFLNRTYTLNAGFYDVARIEVLKGPQGTLFGRNSTGGLVNILTEKPKLGGITSGFVQGTLGDYNLRGIEGAVNVPLSDTTAFRVSALRKKRDGYRRRVPIGDRTDDMDLTGARGQLLFKPSDKFDLLAFFEYNKLGGTGPASATTTDINASDYTGDPNVIRGFASQLLNIKSNTARIEANYHLPGDLTLTYTGGLDKTNFSVSVDNSTAADAAQVYQARNDVRTQNHELRLASPGDQALNYQVGLFYFDELNSPLYAHVPRLTGTFAGTDLIVFSYDVKTKSEAAFGQVGYKFDNNLTLTGGLRYTEDTVSRVGFNALNCLVAGIPSFLYATLGCTGTPPLQTTIVRGYQSGNKTTYMAGADWQLTDTNMVYAKYATGYKAGGFNTDAAKANIGYGPETVTSLEAGTKNTFLNGRMIFNLAVFHQIWDGYQTSVSQFVAPGATLLTSVTPNAGKATTDGAEFSLNVRMPSKTGVEFSGALLNSRFGNGIPKVDGVSGTVDISGNQLPDSPKAALNLSLTQEFAVKDWTLNARIDGQYKSAFYFNYDNRPDYRADAATSGNVSLGLDSPRKDWHFNAYVNNFTNKLLYSNKSIGTSGQKTFAFRDPRNMGVLATYKF